MTEIQEICRVAGASYPDLSVAASNEEVLDQLNDMSLLARMLQVAIEATGTPDADGTITYYGSRLTRRDFPQAYERYISIHGAVPEWSATKKIQGTIAALADRLSPASRSALGVPDIRNFPRRAGQIQSWLNNILGNGTVMDWIRTGLTADTINQRLAASGLSTNDREILTNLLKLVQMRDVASRATGTPATAASMTGLGCQLSGADPNFCPGASSPDTNGAFDVYMTIHNQAPNNTATSKVRRTIERLTATLPQDIKTALGITGSVSDWISGIRTLAQAQDLLHRVNGEILERCGRLEVGIVSISPTEVQQGQTVTLTVNGVHFPADTRVQFYLGTEEDSTITVVGTPTVAADGNSLTVEITVAANASTTAARTIRLYSQADATYEARSANALAITASAAAVPGSCADELDNDHDTDIDDADSDCQPASGSTTIAGEQELDGDARTSYVLNNVLGMRARAGLGYSAIPADLPYQLSPVMPANLALNLSLNDVTVVGGPNTAANAGENPLFSTPQDIFRLYGSLSGSYQTFLQDGANHTGGAALSLTPRVRPLGSDLLYIDATGSLAYAGADYANPTLMYFDGHELMTTARLALGSDFTTHWLNARIFGGYRHNWFDLRRETSGLYQLDGQRRGGLLGLQVDADLPELTDDNNYPALSLIADYGWGSTYQPSYVNGQSGHDLEDQRIIRARLEGYWTVPGINPFGLINLAHLSQGPEEGGDSNNMWLLQISGGVDSSYGLIAGGYGHVNNIGLYDQAGDQNGGFLQYALPTSLPGWSGITVRGDLNSFDGNVVGGGMLMFDFMRGLFPNPPQPVQGPIPTANTAALPLFMQY